MSDLAALITAASALIAAVGSIVSLAMHVRNRGELRTMHVLINSRLSELIAGAARTGHAEGKAEGRVEEDARDRAREEKATAE